MTTEKLHSETARANAAERQIADVMSLFRNTHNQKIKLESELLRVREELSLYKVQLDVAQKGSVSTSTTYPFAQLSNVEIFRAQEVVERIDRQRVEAEESAVRAREKSRKLAEARAVDRALEEGRRLGFEEGLNQGRMIRRGEHDPQRNRKESSASLSDAKRSRQSRSTTR
jgi:flagellar biosynthesis/type III secretory pathway protein FliH